MTQNEILEGNALIAKFMGFKPESTTDNRYFNMPDIFYKYDDCHYKITNTASPESMLYHSSWDWLMPVVEKIESLGYTVTIAGIMCKINVVLDIENPVVSWVLGDKSRKLELVYTTIVSFIKWYNENK